MSVLDQVFNTLREVLRAPREVLCLVFGSLLVLLAFLAYEGGEESKVAFPADPNWWLLGPGLVLLLLFVISGVASFLGVARLRLRKTREGFEIDLAGGRGINILFGRIEEAEPDASHGAIVLPVNTSFDDECLRDARSATGSFFLKYFPHSIEAIQSLIQSQLDEGGTAEGGEDAVEYPVGTALLLDKPLGSDHRVIVVAATRFSPEHGISADTESVVISVRSVFRMAARHRISELHMPVLGTGHGDLEFSTALGLILLQAIHCMRFEGVSTVRRCAIVVHDPGGTRGAEVARIVRSVAGIP